MKKYIITFLISMVPVIELRGAIPAAIGMGLDIIPAFALSCVGNLLPVPFILIFIERILEWMKTKKLFAPFANWLESKANKHKEKALRGDDPDKIENEEKREKGRKVGAFIGLMLFVGIPLPGTGAWTGSLIAALFKVKKKVAIPAIIIGVLLAGVLVSLICGGVLKAFEFLL